MDIDHSPSAHIQPREAVKSEPLCNRVCCFICSALDQFFELQCAFVLRRAFGQVVMEFVHFSRRRGLCPDQSGGDNSTERQSAVFRRYTSAEGTLDVLTKRSTILDTVARVCSLTVYNNGCCF